MSIDYIVSSLPSLVFGASAPISWEKFCETVGEDRAKECLCQSTWADLEAQLRNAIAEARGGERFKRPVVGCSLYWKSRAMACFQEKDIARREELLDKVWWDAAEELTAVTAPLGIGALATYAVRLKIALKRTKISKDLGNAAFDRLTAATKVKI